MVEGTSQNRRSLVSASIRACFRPCRAIPNCHHMIFNIIFSFCPLSCILISFNFFFLPCRGTLNCHHLVADIIFFLLLISIFFCFVVPSSTATTLLLISFSFFLLLLLWYLIFLILFSVLYIYKWLGTRALVIVVPAPAAITFVFPQALLGKL